MQWVLRDESRWHDYGSDWATIVECFAAEQVEIGHMLGVTLPVPGREIEADRVAGDVALCLCYRYPLAALPNDYGELHLVVELVGLSGVADRFPLSDQSCTGRFQEEDRNVVLFDERWPLGVALDVIAIVVTGTHDLTRVLNWG